MARPKKYQIDTSQLKKLSSLGCTNKEMGDFFGCSADLLEKRKGRTKIKIKTIAMESL